MMSSWDVAAFSDEQFEEILSNLDRPSLEGYELFTDCRGVQIYRKKHQTSGLYQYKIVGVDEELDAKTCSLVYRDLDYRREWDSYVGELTKVAERDGVELIYWMVKYPFPLWSRDYVFARRTKELRRAAGDRVWITIGKSCQHSDLPEKSGIVRVEEFRQVLAIMYNTEGPGAKLYMEYYDDPKGLIPAWLINYMASAGVAAYLDQVKKACLGYK